MSDSGGTVRTLWVFDAAQGVQSATTVRGALQGVQRAGDTLSAAQARTALTAGKLATEHGKAAVQAQKLATEEQKTATQTANAAKAQDQAAITALRLAKAQNEAAKGGSGLGRAIGDIQQGLGAVGIGVGIQQIVSFEVSAGKAALSLRETLNGLKAVSGSYSVYASAVQTAREQQVLFGGTLQENIEGLQGLVITSRDTGAELQSLVDLSQRLSVKSPEQGAAGARLALAEAFSEGNITSLSRRFEIPKQKIAELRDASIPAAEKVKILSNYLDSIGISSAAVAGKIDKTAKTYREFTAALEGTRIALGDLFAAQGAGAAGSATGALTGITQLVGAYNQVAASSGQVGQVVSAFVNPLSYYNNLVLNAGAGALKWAGATFGLADATRQSAGIFDEERQAVGRAQLAHEGNTNAISKETREKLEDQVASAQLAQEQRNLERDSIAAANGLLGAGDQAILLGQKYGIATELAQGLINAQQQLSNATALADQRLGERDPSNNLTAAQNAKFGRLARQGLIDRSNENKKIDEQEYQERQRLEDARNQNRLINAKTSAQKIAELQRQQRATTDPVEKQQLQNQIDQEKQSGAKRVGAAQTTGLQLQNVEENAQAALLKAQREGQERLRDQEQDYQLSRTRKQEDFQQRYVGLLARGERAAAAKAKAEFEKDQKRDAEDRAIQLRRTLRNNGEALGDTTGAAERRSSQIQQRAALRGVTGTSSGGGGGSAASVGGGGSSSNARIIQVTLPSSLVMPDGQVIANVTYPFIVQRLDDDLEIEIHSAPPLGSNQGAVAGARP